MNFRETHPVFQQKIQTIAATVQESAEVVYGKWREYSDECSRRDQSAVWLEFIDWYYPSTLSAVSAALEGK